MVVMVVVMVVMVVMVNKLLVVKAGDSDTHPTKRLNLISITTSSLLASILILIL